MNIAVNTRLLLKNKLEGIGWFTYETIKRIVLSHPEHHFFFLFDRKYDKEFIFSDNITPLKVFPPTRHAFLWYVWFEMQLPKVLNKHKIDIFVSPDGYLPLKTNVPSVAVIHDINFVHRPEDIPFWANWYYNKYFPKFAQKATQIVTVSNYSKNDIIQSFQIPPEKINVAYNGVNPVFCQANTNVKENIKQTYTNGNDFFVFVGAMHPRKNVPGLLQAFERFKENTKYNNKLVIVGEKMHKTNEIDVTLSNMKFKKDVLFVGRKTPGQLRDIVASASAMVFVPFFEGFGIPIVEAMKCGTPVICSNKTSMPEVAGDAALIVDPENIEEIAFAMEKLINDKTLSDDLSKKGLERANIFSWDKTADQLWHAIEKTMQNA